MRNFRSVWMPAFFLLFPLTAQPQDSEPLFLVNARVIDATGGEPYEAAVLVRQGRIARIERNGTGQAPDGVRKLDLNGKYLLPGFIDAHVHINTADQARTALLSGVTTARSMGSGNFADVGLRELVRSGAVEGPELLAAGYHIRPHLADAFFLDEPTLAALMGGVHGADNYRKVTAANLEREVDFIKVVATDRAGLPETDPRRQIMTEEELAAVVAAARRAEVPVAAHAHGDEGGRAAVRAGVRSIEHGTYLSEQTLRLMKEKGTFLVPTLAVVRDLNEPDGDYDNTVLRLRGRHMLPRLQQMVRSAHQIGVPIVAATDTDYGPASLLRMAHDIQELTLCGLSPIEAIQSATLRAAQLLQIEDRTGTIQPGKEADLIAVEGNPLEDIGALQDILLVISNGRIALDRLQLGME
ncbi:MAG: amidohydrolase family protein [Acidobacteriota bacterium]